MSITEFVQSPGYKKVMGKVYGFGAAVVLLGALWKILHLPGAAPMLVLGMGTEIIIFALSAFEPPHELPDWSLVYPELVGLESSHGSHGGHGAKGVSSGGGSELQALIQSGNLDEKTVAELTEGIKKLSQTSNQLANLTDASVATESYLQNIQAASESVGKLGNAQTKSAKVLDESTTALAEVYSSLQEDVKSIGQNGKEYSAQLSNVSKNLASINSIYELQLKGAQGQVDATKNVSAGLEEISGYLKESIEGAKVYRDQVTSLNKTVGELNTIYGNMLSAMNVGNR